MEIKPVRDLENGRVELVYSRKLSKSKSYDRHFSVPADKKDSFVSEFKKHAQTANIFGWLGTGIATLAGIWLGGKISSKKILSWAGGVAGGFAFGFGALNILSRQIYKKQQEIFDKYDVQQVTYLREDTSLKSDNAVTSK